MTAAPFVKPEPTEPDPWPDLIPLDAPSLPRLDVSLLPGWAGAFARELAADTETPPELASGMVLATAATAVARTVRLCVRSGYFEPLNLWVAAALTPGNRKSAVSSVPLRPAAGLGSGPGPGTGTRDKAGEIGGGDHSGTGEAPSNPGREG
jgi:hypothetical protein